MLGTLHKNASGTSHSRIVSPKACCYVVDVLFYNGNTWLHQCDIYNNVTVNAALF